MIGAVLGLAAAALIGLSDLFGRRITPKSSPITAALTLQLFAAAAVLGALTLWPGHLHGAALVLGVISGLGFAVGLCCYYVGLSCASSAIVAPVAAVLSVLVPYFWALTKKLDVSFLSSLGVFIALIGLLLAAKGALGGPDLGPGLKWGLASGLGYGIGQAVLLNVEALAGPVAIASQRVAAFLVMITLAVVARKPAFPPSGTRSTGALAGICAGAASVALFQGLQFDPLATVTAVAIFPVFTVAIGRAFYRDAVTRTQSVGILFAVVGTIAVVAG